MREETMSTDAMSNTGCRKPRAGRTNEAPGRIGLRRAVAASRQQPAPIEAALRLR